MQSPLESLPATFTASALLDVQRRSHGLGLTTLRGRLVELSRGPASCVSSFALSTMHQAQCEGEPVVWVTSGGALVLPEDVVAAGVDPSALAIVQAPDGMSALRATERLLRSGGFGVLVVDLAEVPRIDPNAIGRLGRLAEQHDAACLLIVDGAESGRLGSLVSLRLAPERGRELGGGVVRQVRPMKDKRGRIRRVESEACDGPDGLC